MLSIYGAQRQAYCDGVSRRSFLKVGGFALGAFGGLTLADLLRAQAAAGSGSNHKALINVFLAGGPPHQEMWEVKTEAPSEIRGPFQAIPTKLPGVHICEVYPRVAGLLDKAVVIRSVVGSRDIHDGYQCMSGWFRNDLAAIGGRPGIGSVASSVLGPVDRSIPPFVGLCEPTREIRWSEAGAPGFLGPGHQAFKPHGRGMDDLTLNDISLERLQDRKQLLGSLDTLKRSLDADGMIRGMDAFTEAAVGVLTSSRLAEALDLEREDPSVRERYGTGRPYQFQYDGPPTVNEHLLLARRLVEVGVRCVSLSYGRWDSHNRNEELVRDHGPKLDQALSALVEDLDQRGMLDDVLVLVWGEFGRTPRINQQAGRDHWPQVSCALLAGGGIRAGQCIGATNRLGEYATERPVEQQEILATAYHCLGIDPRTTTLLDPAGRPQHLLTHTDPLRELV